MEEKELVVLLKAGDEASFKSVVETYQHMVYNTVLGILRDEEDAEDIAQEVFVEVFLSISQFKGESKLSTWIYRIALTKAWDFIRYKKRKKRFAPLISLFTKEGEKPIDPPDFVHPGMQLENKEKGTQLFKAIDSLAKNQQTAFILHKMEGLSYQEIADIMEMSLSSVESLMHRAKINLQKKLANYYLHQ